ncbi:MAG: flavin-containing monooxygenase [Thermocrispum sp.]
MTRQVPEHEVLIVGAGFAGLCAAIRLKDAGVRDFVILERADDIGGTWRDNRYPGVAVDIPSVMYQFSFAQTGGWRRVFARGAEVKSYIDDVATRHRLREHVQFGHEVTAAEFDDRGHFWTLTTAGGREITARFVISAHGIFGKPQLPKIDGIDEFAGRKLHTLQWDQGYDPSGDRVAVIGTGATAVQLVPEVAKTAARLDVYQRTPIWVVPRPDVAVSPRVRRLLAGVPPLRWAASGAVGAGIELAMLLGVPHHRRMPFLVKRIRRLSELHLQRQVRDPRLRAELLPSYEFGCKRPALSNDYWRTFTRDNVGLVTDPIVRVLPHGVQTADGTVREIDTLVLATGFQFMDRDSVPGFRVRGEGGVDLRDWWREHGFGAYEGITVPRFPNLFVIPAPHFATSWSWLVIAETQTLHAQRVISHARERGATYAAVREEAYLRYFDEMNSGHEKGLFVTPACDGSNSYYLDPDGKPSAIRPQSSVTARWRAGHFPLRDYEVRAAYRAPVTV